MRRNQALHQTIRQKADFRLIAANQVLQKGALSLRQHIQDELSSNPALEMATDLLCPTCGSPIRAGDCRFCSGLIMLPEPGLTRPDGSIVSLAERQRNNREDRHETADVAAPVSLADYLHTQAQSLLSNDDLAIANYLIANIDEKGLLECELEEVSRELSVHIERVARVLKVIQCLDPVGIGARTPQEALLIQLQHLVGEQEIDPYAEQIIRSCWEDLAYQRYPRIVRAIGCTLEQARTAAEFIRDNLNPYPASAFTGHHPQSAAQAIRWPDLIIHREQDDFRVEVVESYESELRISDSFLRLRQAVSAGPGGVRQSEASLEALRRACFFLACLKMRKKTLQEVSECIVKLQRGYLDTGLEEHLRPLTRAKVAALLGKHESTVSRAVTDKYVLLPNRRLIPFEKFFTPGAAPKSIITELIQRELQGQPLTDSQISRILASRGYRVARRTVAKYRLALRIPPSTQRRAR